MAKETIHSTEAEMFSSLFRDMQIFLLSLKQQAPDSKVTKATDEEKEGRQAGTRDPLPSQTPTALGPPTRKHSVWRVFKLDLTLHLTGLQFLISSLFLHL